MYKIIAAICLSLVVLMTPIYGQTINRIDGTKITADSLQYRIQYLMKTANVTGLAITVFNDNQPIFSKTFGLADVKKKAPLEPESVMYAASLSKLVFSYLVMQLVAEKKLDLDKPLVSYLDSSLVDYKMGTGAGYQDLKNDDRYQKITARMCLSHTTGFPNFRELMPDKKLRIITDPGSRYRYSGEGIELLQFVIEKITGQDYESLAQERVFKPLNMGSTSQVWQKRFEEHICYGYNAKGKTYPLFERDNANAAGSMSTTLADFTKFYTALIGNVGITPQYFEEMTTKQVSIRSKRQFGPLANQDGPDNDVIGLGYGLGVGVFTTPYGKAFFKEGHGNGWQHYTICYPEKKIAIIIMTNSDNGESIFKELLAVAIGDVFTPWQWENYVPYDQKMNK
jgi:D-alanyl-D-alanine-carboxypeptidase/D-alanyl-D-alanine-endopeptidase